MTSLTSLDMPADPERFQEFAEVKLGQWYWVQLDEDTDEKTKDPPWFGCVMEIGSNYFKLESPGGVHARVHKDDFVEVCKLEQQPRSVIETKILTHKTAVEDTLREIRELTMLLGITPTTGIEQENEARSLSVLNAGAQDMKAYKKSLTVAKEKTLPELFQVVEDNNKCLSTWMKAEILPMKATMGNMKDCIEVIEDRIFHVELYAGLTEDIYTVRKGNPAPADAKLHIMQGRLFMDEECLVDYQAGGMSFRNIREFDKWLLKPQNINSILPHPRSMVAFQVRRNVKERYAGTLLQAYINISLENEDRLTFIYIRNGQQVYCIKTEVELRWNLFPDVSEFDFHEPLMAKEESRGKYSFITVREHEERLKKREEAAKLYDAWEKENPDKHSMHNPHSRFLDSSDYYSSRFDRWRPFDSTNVYYDDAKASIEADMKYYNRVVLILQGLFDRSPILNPHPPAKLYDPVCFGQLVELIYDRDRALYAGPKPDWKVFQAELNKSLRVGSVIVGQQEAWRRKRKEERERQKEARGYGSDRERYEAHPDPGPALLAVVTAIKGNKVSCAYMKPRQRATGGKSWRLSGWDTKAPEGKRQGDLMETTCTVPIDEVMNVSAYTPGDYKMFFADPRTRPQYLQWAPYLLVAEDYCAGKRKPSMRAYGNKDTEES